MYENISSGLAKHGIICSANQCRDKIKKLKSSYKKAKDNNRKAGKGRAVWKFFDVMDRVLGHWLASQAPVVIDTSLSTHDDNSNDTGDLSDGLGLSPVIEESQEPDNEHTAQEEPDVSAQAS